MTSPWMPPASIEEEFQQVQDGINFTKYGREIVTKHKQVCMEYKLMHKTSRFGTACKCCQEKSGTYKTWVNLKTHFKASDQYQHLNAKPRRHWQCQQHQQ